MQVTFKTTAHYGKGRSWTAPLPFEIFTRIAGQGKKNIIMYVNFPEKYDFNAKVPLEWDINGAEPGELLTTSNGSYCANKIFKVTIPMIIAERYHGKRVKIIVTTNIPKKPKTGYEVGTPISLKWSLAKED